jgi:hypothetical protein
VTVVETSVRSDLAEAYELALGHVAAPGAFFTADRRVRIAEAAIAAYLDAEPGPPWVRPYGDLPLDVAHRLGRHAATITAEWYEQVVTEGLHPLEWVEIVGVVVAALPPVAFARAAGLPLPDLPAPRSGAPHGREAAELAPARLNFVPVAAPADETAAVVQALSALPDEWDNLWRMAGAQYMSDRQMDDPLWNRGTLSRPQMELVAARLATLRDCVF